jgi:hypothetical protein
MRLVCSFSSPDMADGLQEESMKFLDLEEGNAPIQLK